MVSGVWSFDLNYGVWGMKFIIRLANKKITNKKI